jgi:hypothetical protein
MMAQPGSGAHHTSGKQPTASGVSVLQTWEKAIAPAFFTDLL